jgi:hypothetical protein
MDKTAILNSKNRFFNSLVYANPENMPADQRNNGTAGISERQSTIVQPVSRASHRQEQGR